MAEPSITATAAAAVLVVRNPITGESWDFGELREGLTVSQLKVKIKDRLKVPQLVQKLLIDGRVLAERQVLSAADAAKAGAAAGDAGGKVVLIDMVVCLEPLLKTLHTGCRPGTRAPLRSRMRMGLARHFRLSMLDILAEWQPKGQNEVILALFKRLDVDRYVRERALSVLPLVAKQGDKLALAEARKLLQKGGVQRLYGARAIGLLAEKGDAESFASLAAQLRDGSELEPLTFSAVLDALAAASQDDTAMVRALLAAQQLNTSKSLIKQIRVLTQFAERGCEESVAFLSAQLRHPCAEVQLASIEALGLLANRPDWSVVNLLRPRLQHLDTAVRLAAVRALGSLATEEDGGTIAGLSARLQDENEKVRSAAKLALWRVTAPSKSGQDCDPTSAAETGPGVTGAAETALLAPLGDLLRSP